MRRETPERGGIAAETFSAEGWDLSYQVTNGKIPLEQLTEVMLERNDAMQVAINSTSLSNLLAADFVANPLESTPGALAWSFGLLGLIAAGRRARGWAAIAAGFSILTLGPFLLIDATPPIPDWSLERPLPYYYFYNEVPFFSKAYRPYRLGVVTLLALSALAALGLGRLRPRLRSPVAAAATVSRGNTTRSRRAANSSRTSTSRLCPSIATHRIRLTSAPRRHSIVVGIVNSRTGKPDHRSSVGPFGSKACPPMNTTASSAVATSISSMRS